MIGPEGLPGMAEAGARCRESCSTSVTPILSPVSNNYLLNYVNLIINKRSISNNFFPMFHYSKG